ncbi:hypothetical protein SK128_013049, partial [Halocaridina rubra]
SSLDSHLRGHLDEHLNFNCNEDRATLSCSQGEGDMDVPGNFPSSKSDDEKVYHEHFHDNLEIKMEILSDEDDSSDGLCNEVATTCGEEYQVVIKEEPLIYSNDSDSEDGDDEESHCKQMTVWTGILAGEFSGGIEPQS